MKVFVTGASGFVGSAVVENLIARGHTVLGLARSEAAAAFVEGLGATVLRGNLEDLASLKKGASEAEGIIHCGFNHDFSRFQENCEQDRKVIGALAQVLANSTHPMVVTSGINLLEGALLTEDLSPTKGHPRIASEEAVQDALKMGVNASIVRLPPSVHGNGPQGYMFGFGSVLMGTAKEKGFSAYVGDGENVWSAVHRRDAAELFVLALEKAKSGACYHGAAEGNVRLRDISETIGRKLGLPTRSLTLEEAPSHFGWFAHFVSENSHASSAWTQKTLGWKPTRATLLEDLEAGGSREAKAYS
jgi:nucleoside-diphosphate-sugar epimerase